MIRKTLTVTAVLLALVFGVLSQPASADHSAEAVTYPGPFTNMPPAPMGPYGFGTQGVNVTAASPAPAPAGVPALAVTGAETTVLAYAGFGLIGFGALAVGNARRRRI